MLTPRVAARYDRAMSQDPETSDSSPQEPPRPLVTVLGLRVSSFLLAVLLGISLGASGLIAAAQYLDVGHVDPKDLERVFAGDEKGDPVLGLWLRVGTLPLVLWIAWFFTVHFDGDRLADIGLRRPRNLGKEALPACCAGALVPMLWWLVLLPLDGSDVAPLAVGVEDGIGLLSLPGFLLMFLLLVFQDELIYRGYIYSTLRRRWSWVHAAGLTNLLALSFYAGHEGGKIGMLNFFLLGLILAAMREKTGSLWMSTLFAGVWAGVQACVLSLPLHGMTYPRLFEHRLEGPEGLTGGSFGPQASWTLTVILLFAVALAAWWAERRGLGSVGDETASTQDP